jgi:DNA polymerase III alpha subunit (gram-positive type)
MKYGSNPDKIIVERLEKELNAVINNGYAVVY